MTIGEQFNEHILEILLMIVLAFNVAAYHKLEENISVVEEKADENQKNISMVQYRIFGIDDTDAGHLESTDERFEDLQTRLEKICRKIDEESVERENQFKFIEGQLDQMIEKLSDEDNINIEKDDITIHRNT